MIHGQNISDQPVQNNLKTYDNIQKIAIGQGGDYTNGCLLDNNYLNNCYKMIVIDLSKQQALDADNFTGNLEKNAKVFFIIE